ncbi:nickel pincer cofactor biosynthesis protein LarC [Oculatella sp. LEGE 06141]|uniref:nickel pincer cofactor biosynthesis protein LarC n=1 Tax=Oculatella sp. LEGE 06141 TaxID=1828648 RepID=UPI0018806627|nr:nickel pincer cofactor biosynthesis protein LarC [Oculatella sp. LEGE 06141]MBE9180993.1 nickel pincer cofactor biosynthesis protein LarC [Oculatella sp. LEGE 06141]
MTKVAYLECPTGLAGDMCLGALVHAGVPLDYLTEQLARLGIASDYQLRSELVHRNGQQATKVHVDLISTTAPVPEAEESGVDPYPTFGGHSDPTSPTAGHPGHSGHEHPAHQHTRHLPEIEQLIHAANLPPRAAAWSLAIFRRLAEAEGAVHGIAPDQVHFHEVGATDAIVDIVGTCLGLDWLGIEQLHCSALPTGGGTVRAAHGRLPVPTPAVLKLWELRQVPVYSNGIERELVTPTGAAIATTLATRFGAPPPMVIQTVGLGAGSRNLPIPNILRLWLGETASDSQPFQAAHHPPIAEPVPSVSHPPNHTHSPVDHSPQAAATTLPPEALSRPPQETITVLETQIDDLNPQAIGYLFEVLFAAGAVDVFTQAIGMKKSRPGMLVTVICHPEQAIACETVLFRETTTLGIRHTVQRRTALHREIQTVQTQHGSVRIKIARPAETAAVVNVQPEYEDCANLAQQHHLPWREVHQAALCAWYDGCLVSAEP